MVLSAQVDKKKFDQWARLFPKETKREMGDAFDHISKHFLKQFKAKRLQGPPGVRGRPRGIFSHFKRASLISPSIHNMGLRIWSDSQIAALHETGGIVRHPSGRRLAVPLSARTVLFTSTGKLRKRYKDPRSLKSIWPEKINGKTFLVRRNRSNKESIEPLFVMKQSVRIKSRLGFFKVWDSLETWRVQRINKALDRVLQ